MKDLDKISYHMLDDGFVSHVIFGGERFCKRAALFDYWMLHAEINYPITTKMLSERWRWTPYRVRSFIRRIKECEIDTVEGFLEHFPSQG